MHDRDSSGERGRVDAGGCKRGVNPVLRLLRSSANETNDRRIGLQQQRVRDPSSQEAGCAGE
jgi:hypothetical protein